MEKKLEKILVIIDELDNEDRARVAAGILNETDPGRGPMAAFFDRLDATVHNELISRAADRDEKE